MKKVTVLILILSLIPFVNPPTTHAANITAVLNFDGAALGASCIPSINADPYLEATRDGSPVIVNSNHAGGSAPECRFPYFAVIRIHPEAGNMLTGVTFRYSGSFRLQLYNTVTSSVVVETNLNGTGVYSYSGAQFDDIYLQGLREDGANYIDNTPGATSTNLAGCVSHLPIYSSALVTMHQPGFWKPDGDEIVLPDGTKLDVLHDVDQNGQDEFLVIAKETVGDERWVGLFIGACEPVYVPLANVTLLRPMEW